MWKYLKYAFLARLPIAGLGRVPVNAIGVAVFVILGFGHPACWLLGIGLETAYLFGLATNKRFQRVIDAVDVHTETVDVETQRRQLVSQLIPPARERLSELDAKCARAVDLSRRQGADEFLLQSNAGAFDKLRWIFLRLLLARQIMLSQENSATESNLRRQIDQLEKELRPPALASTLRESKTATLKILERRLEVFQRRGQAIEEIDADLQRIEAQVDLAVENASLSAQPPAISGNITLASTLLESELFGSSQPMIETLDQSYGSLTAEGRG